MSLRVDLNGNLVESCGAMNGFASHCQSRIRHVKEHGALYSKIYTAGDQR